MSNKYQDQNCTILESVTPILDQFITTPQPDYQYDVTCCTDNVCGYLNDEESQPSAIGLDFLQFGKGNRRETGNNQENDWRNQRKISV